MNIRKLRRVAGVVALVAALVACERGTEPRQGGAPQPPRAVSASPRALFVSPDKRWTNLSYQSAAVWAETRQQVRASPAELLHACRVAPDNPDVWLLAATHMDMNVDDLQRTLGRAIALAPDAFLPRFLLFEQLNRWGLSEETYHAATSAFAYAVAPGDVQAWSECAAQTYYPYNAPGPRLYHEFLARQAATPQVLFARALLAASLGLVTQAVEQAKQTLAVWPDAPVRDALAARLWPLGSNAVLMAGVPFPRAAPPPSEFDALVAQEWSTFFTVLPPETIAAHWRALQLATNAQMRIRAAGYLLDAHAAGQFIITNAEEFAATIVGGESVPPDVMATWLTKLRDAGLSSVLTQEIEHCLAAGAGGREALLQYVRLCQDASDRANARWQQQEVQLADKLAAAGSNDVDMLAAAAGLYARHKLYDEEITCRRAVLKLSRDELARGHAAVALGTALLNAGDPTGAYALLPLAVPAARAGGELACTVARWQLARGDARAACALLLDVCTSAFLLAEARPALQLLADTSAPTRDLQDAVVQSCLAWLGRTRYDPWRGGTLSLNSLLAQALANADDAATAFACMTNGMLNRDCNYALQNVFDRPHWRDAAARYISYVAEQAATNQAHLNYALSLARTLNDYPQCVTLTRAVLACDPQAVHVAADMLRDAQERKDHAVQDEMFATIARAIRASGDATELLNRLWWCGGDPFNARKMDALYELAWRTATNQHNPRLLDMLMRRAIEHGTTNLVRELATFISAAPDAPLERHIQMCAALQFLGETNAAASAAVAILSQLTNAALVLQHSEALLRFIAPHAPNNMAVAAFILACATNLALPMHVRSGFINRSELLPYDMRTQVLWHAFANAPGSHRQFYLYQYRYAARYARDTNGFLAFAEFVMAQPDLNAEERRTLAGAFLDLGCYDHAAVQYELALERMAPNAPERGDVLNDLTRLHILLGHADQALQCARDALDTASAAERGRLAAQIAETLANQGMAAHAHALLAGVLEQDLPPRDLRAITQFLITCNDVGETGWDVQRLAARLAVADPSINGLGTVAELLTRYGAYDTARAQVQQRLATTTAPAEQAALYEYLAKIAEICGNAGDEAAARAAQLAVAPAHDRPAIATRLCEVLAHAGQYADIVAHVERVLADSAAAVPTDVRMQLLRSKADAHIKLGQPDAAWATAQRMDDPSAFFTLAQELGRVREARGRLEELLSRQDAPLDVRNAALLMSTYEACNDREACARLAKRMVQQGAPPDQQLDLARLCARGGMMDEAITMLTTLHRSTDRALSTWDRREAATELVNLLRARQRYDDALRWINASADESLRRALAARVLDDAGRARDAVEAYCDAILARQDAGDDLPYHLAKLVERVNDPALRAYVDKRLALDPAQCDVEMCASIASAYERLRRPAEALYWLQQAEARADSPQRKTDLQWSQLEQAHKAGDWDVVIRLSTAALTGPQLRWGMRDSARERLAEAYERTGQPLRAEHVRREQFRDMETVLKRPGADQDYNFVCLRAAELYRRRGDYEKARALLTYAARNRQNTWVADCAARALQHLP